MLWCYCGCLTAVKLSLLFQYKKIFATPRFQIAVTIMIVIVALTGLWTVFSGIFICWPISFFWTHEGNGKCFKTWPLFIGNAGAYFPLPLCSCTRD